MTIAPSSLVKALIAPMCLAGCLPAQPFDGEFKDQFEGGSGAQDQLFASGYFPPSFANSKVDCDFLGGQIELIGEVEQDWYPRQWKAAREPSFYLLSERGEPPQFALRFSYIPSFTPSVFIRVHKEGDAYWLIAKEMDGAGGYDPGAIKRSKKVRLSAQQVNELKRILAEDALFSEPPASCQLGFDGSNWIYEMIDSNGYRMIKWWSPTEGRGYNLGRYLIELSDWNLSCWSSLPRPFSEIELLCE